MDVAITRMSRNGQVVIPAEMRRVSDIKPGAKFLVLCEKGNILLKPIREGMLRENIEQMSRIEKSEMDFLNGKDVKADSRIGGDDIDDLLMGD